MNHGGGRAFESPLAARKRRLSRPVNIVSVELPVDTRSERRRLTVTLTEPFRPFALVVWGAKVETKVRDIVTGAESQVLATIPGFMFEADIPFDEYRRLLAPGGNGYPLLSMASFDKVGHIFELSMQTVGVAEPLSLDLEGPLEHAVFLGHVLRDDGPEVVVV